MGAHDAPPSRLFHLRVSRATDVLTLMFVVCGMAV